MDSWRPLFAGVVLLGLAVWFGYEEATFLGAKETTGRIDAIVRENRNYGRQGSGQVRVCRYTYTDGNQSWNGRSDLVGPEFDDLSKGDEVTIEYVLGTDRSRLKGTNKRTQHIVVAAGFAGFACLIVSGVLFWRGRSRRGK